ncbi:MAG: aminomethyl-transferring glycine dehydrogenase subunit GcvPB [Candidatus Omnitrophica bacterium]|nr:aminomethyl-transferring glycine dehydrogenase subunit GcvPB [Candidatus Omnitrophota bacterium]
MTREEPTLAELSRPKKRAVKFPRAACAKDSQPLIPAQYLRKTRPRLPELSELDVVRHFTRLSKLNFSIDTHFYPLGSCTMKYNPKRNDTLSTLQPFLWAHPAQPEELSQGILEILYELEQALVEICGVRRFSLQPAAGAQAEFTGLMIVRAWHRDHGNDKKIVLVPDTSHGTNPASAALVGYQVQTVKSDERGLVDLGDLESHLGPRVACLMLTNPNTLGRFEVHIQKIAKMIHMVGGLLYYDGANLNPLLGTARPGDMGFDIVHLNLHKTFSTPHGGGGPGAGPIGVADRLVPYLPAPLIGRDGGCYFLEPAHPKSIGRVHAFYGNANILIKAFIYIKTLGAEGLKRVGEASVLNANYLLTRLEKIFHVPYPGRCMHEFVVSTLKENPHGIRTLDVAKRLLDFGFHSPTIYFPINVKEAMMIEPTETESRETLDHFVETLETIADEARHHPERLRQSPHTLAVSRPDEVAAARTPKLVWDEPPLASPDKSPEGILALKSQR